MTFAGRAAFSQQVFDTVNDTWGERVRIAPMKVGTFGTGTADGTRTILEIVGVFMTVSDQPARMGKVSDAIQTGDIYLRVTIADATTAKPRQGDVVTLLDRGNERFVINTIVRPTPLRQNLYLIKAP